MIKWMKVANKMNLKKRKFHQEKLGPKKEEY